MGAMTLKDSKVNLAASRKRGLVVDLCERVAEQSI